tara:strand:+ start:4697 stop:5581 length:885 start_codon:yes stop_codon:yes gene_type:complete
MSVNLSERRKIDAIQTQRFRNGAKQLRTAPPKTNPNKLMNNGVENYRFVEIGYAMDMEKSIVGLTVLREYNDEEKKPCLTRVEAEQLTSQIDDIDMCMFIAEKLDLRLDVLLIQQNWPVSHAGGNNRLATLVKGLGTLDQSTSQHDFTGIQNYINETRGGVRKQYKPLNRAGTMFELLCSTEGNSSWFGDGDAFVVNDKQVLALVEWKFTSPSFPVQGESLYRYPRDRGRNQPLRSICSRYQIPLIYVAWGESHEQAKVDLYKTKNINDTNLSSSRLIPFLPSSFEVLLNEWLG